MLFESFRKERDGLNQLIRPKNQPDSQGENLKNED